MVEAKKKPRGSINFNFINQERIFQEKTKKDFISVYNKYLEKLIYFNTKYVKDIEIAKDIATDSFMKSLQKIDTYNPEKALYSTWLFTISRNECIQYLSKNNILTSMDKVVDEEGTTIKDFIEDDSESNKRDNELDNLNIRKGTILKNKINDLKDPYRNVIRLREIEDKSYREITIILRENQEMVINNRFFEKNYENGQLTLVDPESRKEKDVIKMFSINHIVDQYGNDVNYRILERDKDGLISKLEIPVGNYHINAEVPFNMSTLKSQIRNGRIMLQKMVQSEFESLDRLYI